MPFIPDNTIEKPTTWMPEKDEAGGTTWQPEGGFFSKIRESFERGQERVLADIGVYEALTRKPDDLEGALRIRAKMSRKEVLNPIEGNWLTDIVYSSSQTAAQMWEATKKSGKGALIGAGVGGVIGGAVGAVIPTIGEEPVTIGAGAKVGAKLFAAEAAALFSYRQGVGDMYATLVEQGSDPDLAKKVASVAGIPYALIEVAQLKALSPAIKGAVSKSLQKTTQSLLGKAIKKYGKTLTTEVIEEIGQEIVQIGAEDVSKILNKQGITIDAEYLKERGLRLLNVTKEATKGFALLPFPGVAIEAAISSESVNITNEIQKFKFDEGTKEVDPVTFMKAKWPRFASLVKDIKIVPQSEIDKAGIKFAEGEKAAGYYDGVNEIVYVSEDLSRAEQFELIAHELMHARQLKQKGVEWYNHPVPEGLTFDEYAALPQEEKAFAIGDAAYKRYLAEMDKLKKLNEITPEDVQSPLMKVSIALKKSIETYESQEKIRKAERSKRFGEAQTMRQEVEDENWKRKAKSQLKGEYTKLGIEPLENQLPVETLNELDQEIRTSDKLNVTEAINLSDALNKLFREGVIFRPFERDLAEKLWGKNFASVLEAVEEKIKLGDKVTITDYMALPKATAASLDISRTGRQNILLIGDPKLFFKSLVRDWHLFLEDENTARALEKSAILKLDSMGDLLNKSGIRWNDWGKGVGFKTGTERFASRIAGKIPGVKRSERAYAMGGNYIRAMKLMEIAEQRKGIPTTDAEWKHIGHVINILTGEGDPRTFGKYAPILNALFFAPRLLEARVRAFVDLANLKHWTDPEWRPASKILAYHVASFAFINLGMLGLMAQVPGVDVERDPRSTDFGKVRIGDTRIDFWGGYLPLMRAVVHLATRQRKTRGGKIVPQEMTDTVSKFLQSKLGPVPGYVLDLLKGETFYGDYVSLEANSLADQFYHRFTPFFLQDLVDAVKYQGIGMGMATAPLAFHGVGVQTYPLTPGTEALLKKNDLSMKVLGKKWDELGPEVQKLMKENFPDIEMMERKAAFDQTNYSFIGKIEKERANTVNRIYKNLPPDIKAEFDDLKIRPSGISRKISSDWYLNDKRYKEYENTVSKIYRQVLTKLIRSPNWNKADANMKIKMLQMVMDEVKSAVRKQIVNKANISDIEQVRRR